MTATCFSTFTRPPCTPSWASRPGTLPAPRVCCETRSTALTRPSALQDIGRAVPLQLPGHPPALRAPPERRRPHEPADARPRHSLLGWQGEFPLRPFTNTPGRCRSCAHAACHDGFHFTQVFFVFYRFIVPAMYLDLWRIIVLFLIADAVSSYWLAILFQANHVVDEARAHRQHLHGVQGQGWRTHFLPRLCRGAPRRARCRGPCRTRTA